MAHLRHFRLPMPDGIEGLIEACGEDLRRRSKRLKGFLEGKTRKPPLDIVRRHALRDTSLLEDREEGSAGKVFLLANSPALRRMVEVLALKLAMRVNRLPGGLNPEGLKTIQRRIKGQTELTFSEEEITRYLYFFADIEEILWLMPRRRILILSVCSRSTWLRS